MRARHRCSIELPCPPDHCIVDDWRHEKTSPSPDGGLCLFRQENRAGTHDEPGATRKFFDQPERVGRGQRKLQNAEATLDDRFHGVARRVCARGAKDGGRALRAKDLYELVDHARAYLSERLSWGPRLARRGERGSQGVAGHSCITVPPRGLRAGERELLLRWSIPCDGRSLFRPERRPKWALPESGTYWRGRARRRRPRCPPKGALMPLRQFVRRWESISCTVGTNPP